MRASTKQDHKTISWKIYTLNPDFKVTIVSPPEPEYTYLESDLRFYTKLFLLLFVWLFVFLMYAQWLIQL
jgi:hypothetical protein